MKSVLLIVLNILACVPVFASNLPCQRDAEKIVTLILSLENKRTDIGVEVKDKKLENSDLGTMIWFDIQGVYLKHGKKSGELPRTYSHLEFSYENNQCVLASYSMPLAN